MDWIYLALIAPLLWAVVVLIDDNLLKHVYRNPVFGAIISGLFGALPAITLLWNSTVPTEYSILALAAACGFFTVVMYHLYFNALDREEPSIVIALFSITPALLPFLAHIVVGESLTTTQLLGFVIVLLAGIVLSFTDVKKLKISSAFFYILGAAIITDMVLLGTKYVYDHTNFYTGFMYYSLGMGLGGLYHLYYAHFSRQKLGLKKLLRKNGIWVFAVLVVAEVINIAAEFVSNLAVSRGQVSIVKVLENIQPLYMLVFAVLLYPLFPKYFREGAKGRLRLKLGMMLIMLVGVYLAAPSGSLI